MPERKSQPSVEGLSEKQREVLDLVVDRRTNKEIAAKLGISSSAVEQRLQSARRKLGVDRRGDLARAYQGLINTCEESTGAKFQVAQSDASMDHINQSVEANLDDECQGYQVVAKKADNEKVFQPGVERVFDYRTGLIMSRIDMGGIIAGRLAAICVTAASLMMMIVIMTSY